MATFFLDSKGILLWNKFMEPGTTKIFCETTQIDNSNLKQNTKNPYYVLWNILAEPNLQI